MSLLQFGSFAAAMAVALSAVMGGAWLIQRSTGMTGWIDVCWTFGVGLVATVGSLISLADQPQPNARQILVAVLVAIWAIRLGGHILVRTRQVGDDPRYRDLIRQWEPSADRRMFLQLQAQAIVGSILTLSVALAAHNMRLQLGAADFLGTALLVVALAGETLSDRQLHQFRSDPANRGRIYEAGLWRLSRHPNYFFEWVCWLAYPVIAIDWSGGGFLGWLALLAPACMYWALVYVSGIPPLEEHMLRSRGARFREVQARTRAFFPFPKW